MLKNILFIITVFISFSLFSQEEREKLHSEIDTLNQNSLEVYYPENLNDFFDALRKLEVEKKGKVNIVHIGDSHIQGGFFSGKVKDELQNVFGNGGFGFAFPYKLAKTNGNSGVKYLSNVFWESRRNIYPVNGAEVGLSGIALSTNDKDFVIEMAVTNSQESFSRLKVFSPNSEQLFSVGVAKQVIRLNTGTPKKVYYKIKSGDALSIIARKHGTTVVELKKVNKLKGNNIIAGKTLQIPTKEVEPVKISKEAFQAIDGVKREEYFEFKFTSAIDKVYFYPKADFKQYDLNGLVLENNNPGIVYHSIGVNGAKFSDYNKYPLFFKQLKGLEPDLIIVSMGTNEAFDKMSSEAFIGEVNQFMANLKAEVGGVNTLLTTPPPSYFSRNVPNAIATTFSNSLIIDGLSNSYAVWDLYYSLGGVLGLPKLQEQNFLARDLVHYTVKGYEYTGELFFKALYDAYRVSKKE